MKVVSLAEVKDMLAKLGKEREELTREQKIALEYSEKVVKLSAGKTKELIKKLTGVEKINKNQAYKIADLLPTDEEDVMAIFSKETFVPSKEEIKKILEIIGEYL
ncbi:MAG: DNA-directed RNA polymerase subunit F [Candidatus Thermoplasmatota archaeon]|nr:DNA-directed RNA polymerase subunit F [Candidatus Thermoplasmatota archaeon]